MDSLALPPGWVKPTPGYSDGVLPELQLELAKGHELFGAALELIAGRLDCDDILVHDVSRDIYVVVHLTWRGAPEQPPCPTIEMSGSWDAFREWSVPRYDS